MISKITKNPTDITFRFLIINFVSYILVITPLFIKLVIQRSINVFVIVNTILMITTPIKQTVITVLPLQALINYLVKSIT